MKKKLKPKLDHDHDCFWREAATKLAGCVVATLMADGKIGLGSGLVMKVKDGKRVVERWDKDFHEALAFVGIEIVEKQKKTTKKATTSTRAPRRSEDRAA